ncbi:MAG: tRNA lysidine(34) synthetase TilS [Rhodobacter sp.]|nr:tRNA lysidine(34) synthetase TilS [Rhodobacter sp.]
MSVDETAGGAGLARGSGVTMAAGSARLGVAVSGGRDSMAMVHLMARAAPQAGWSFQAVTVDHRLRPEAADEAAFVASVCAGLGVPHDVLVWDHDDITGNLMQAASEARYGLMAKWAREKGVELVMLAHTSDDQAETFLMGLAARRDWMGWWACGKPSPWRASPFVGPFCCKRGPSCATTLASIP